MLLQMAKLGSFLWLSSIPLCVYVWIIHLLYLFLCWWSLRLLPNIAYCAQCCYELWGTCDLFKLMFLDIKMGMELTDHVIVLFLVFWETSILFSTVSLPIYIPINSIQGFPFLHILAYICYLWSFYDSHSDKCEVIGFISLCKASKGQSGTSTLPLELPTSEQIWRPPLGEVLSMLPAYQTVWRY